MTPPWIAAGERPASAASVSAPSESARPAPTSSCGASVQAQPGAGQQPEPGDAARAEQRAGRRARARAGDAALERSRDERRDRHRGDGERGRDRRHAPALDEQQHEQEEHRGEARRQQPEREVGRDVRQARAPRDDRRAAAEDDERRDQRERHLGDEDRLPRDQLREQAADRGPERRARHAGRGPHAHGPALAARELGQQLERRAHGRRAADALHGARPDQERQRGRERTGRRGRGEEHEAAGAHLPGRPPRRQARGRHGRERDREVEGRDDPGDVRDLRVGTRGRSRAARG